MKDTISLIVEKGGGDKVMSYGDTEAFRSDNERECREHGKVYVRGHHTRDGDWVKGYCRDRTRRR